MLISRQLLIVYGVICSGLSAHASDVTIEIHPPSKSSSSYITVKGVPQDQLARWAKAELEKEAWLKILRVEVALDHPQADESTPPVLGKYQIKGDELRFVPRFDFEPGIRYRVKFNLEKPRVEIVSIPRAHKETRAIVEQVYPSGENLPANVLRFYLHFSEPMTQGDSYRHIHLLRADGTEIDLPFLELDEELWTADGKRLTLFIDPGRIKHDVKPRVDLGPVFEPGKEYTLVIDKAWKDADGYPLREDFRKRIKTIEPYTTAHDHKKWKIIPPPPQSKNKLRVTFPRPLDHELLLRDLSVWNSAGTLIKGEPTVSDHERVWEFTPEKAWEAGGYRLVINAALEDAAGNRITEPFEVDVFDKVDRHIEVKTVERRFVIK